MWSGVECARWDVCGRVLEEWRPLSLVCLWLSVTCGRGAVWSCDLKGGGEWCGHVTWREEVKGVVM